MGRGGEERGARGGWGGEGRRGEGKGRRGKGREGGEDRRKERRRGKGMEGIILSQEDSHFNTNSNE